MQTLVDGRHSKTTNLEWKPQDNGNLRAVYRGVREKGFIAGTYIVTRTDRIYQTSFQNDLRLAPDAQIEVLYRGQTVEGALDAADDHYLKSRRINGWLWCSRHLEPPMDPDSIEAMRIIAKETSPIRRGWLPETATD